ncbi:hypothetical protein [Plantactinospora sp. DSM 117369]
MRDGDVLRHELSPGQVLRLGQARIDHLAPVLVRAAALRRRGRVGLGHLQVDEPLAGAQRLRWSRRPARVMA